MNRKVTLLILIATHLAVAIGIFVFSDEIAGSRPVLWLREQTTGEHQMVPVTGEQGEILYWTCSMHPSVRMAGPGNCPICGMDLIPVRRSAAEPPENGAAGDEMPGMPGMPGIPEDAEAGADSDRTFVIDPRRRQLINLQTSPVQVLSLTRAIRGVGTLEIDEREVRHINTKISGWIDQVFVDFELQHVQKGDPLFTVYSPELVASQEEYLLALRTSQELSSSSFDHVSKGARSLVEASRRRLELFDLSAGQIRELETSGKVEKTITVFSPVSGHVMERNAYTNRYVTPETTLYTVADHSRIWAQIEIYETDIAQVRPGQSVVMTTAVFPGEEFRGRITYVYPHLNPETRTMNVRLELANPGLKLKPEMYVTAELEIPLGRTLVVPYSAVLRTGLRDIVFVDQGEGRMELREVSISEKTGEFYAVLDGLSEGEQVVTEANFLVDAEARISGVDASWSTPKPSQHVH